jgi:hypothetical protein
MQIRSHDKHIYGQEPVVEPKLEMENYQWNTLAKYTLYWSKTQEYKAKYSYYKIIDQDYFDWGGNVSGKYSTSETSYYFVPEYNQQNLDFIILNAELEKAWKINRSQFILGIDGAFRKSLDSSLELVDDEALLSTMNTDFVNHDFKYLETDIWKFGVSLKLGRIINIYQSPIQIFIETAYQTIVADYPGNSNRNIVELKLGMNF